MSTTEELKKVRDIIQSFLKSRKILRMYPKNNPIYINTLQEDFGKFKDFFYYQEELTFKIRQNEIFFDTEQVYASAEKEDNLALFFFRDGLREISFKKGLTFEEMEDFLQVISTDFTREGMDDDIVTLFWERDFQNISYVADELVLADEEDYESRALEEIQEKAPDEDSLLKAYEDAFRQEEEVKDVSIVPLSDKDLQALMQELEMDGRDKMSKLVDILFELLYVTDSKEALEELVGFFDIALDFMVDHGDITTVNSMLGRIKRLREDPAATEDLKRFAQRIFFNAGNERIITLLGGYIDSGQEIDEKPIEDFVKFLDRNAIVPFMKILGELQSIHARKIVIETLTYLGVKDIATLAKGLSDPRWYVVRNIIYILRKIGDKRAVEYLQKTLRHGDIRVKKEVIRTLGELGGTGVLQALRECLEDPDSQVRSATLKSFAQIGTEPAKRIILNKITEKTFGEKDFEEKKEFFEALSKWKDREVFDFMITTVKKTTFFGRARNYELRSCAAYGLGLGGNKDAVTVLAKYRNDGNRMFREFVLSALKRLEHG